jgi:hypothetical protein
MKKNMKKVEERTICDIVADAKEGIIPSHEECYWTMLSLSSMLYFSRRELEEIAKSMDKGKNLEFTCKIHLQSEDKVHEKHTKWLLTQPKKWLGESGNPFTETNKKWRDMGRKIIKNATGLDV